MQVSKFQLEYLQTTHAQYTLLLSKLIELPDTQTLSSAMIHNQTFAHLLIRYFSCQDSRSLAHMEVQDKNQ